MPPKELVRQQAKLLRLMRAGAQYYIRHIATTGDLTCWLSEADVVELASDQSFGDELTLTEQVSLAIATARVYDDKCSREKLEALVEDCLQYDLGQGEVTLAISGRKINHMAGLKHRLGKGLEILRAESQKHEDKALRLSIEELACRCAENKSAEMILAAFAEAQVVFVGKPLRRLFNACHRLADQYHEAERMPDILCNDQKIWVDTAEEVLPA